MIGEHPEGCSCHLCLPGRHYLDVEEFNENTEPPADPATPEEQAAHEAEMAHPENIYNIKGRIANAARGSSASLTTMGEALCNMQAHNMKELYIFADAIDPFWAERLRTIIRQHEEMPAKLIALQPRKR